MDWSKAKTILIIALLITNAVLIFNYGFADEKRSQVSDDQVLSFLADKNIHVNMILPQVHKDMPVLEVEHDGADQIKIDAALMEFEEKTVVGNEYAERAEEFLKACGFMTETVEFDGIDTGEQIIVRYKNVWNGIAIEESYMNCIFQDGVLVDFQRSWLRVAGGSQRKIGTISATDALLDFMAKSAEVKSISVTEMEMIYWLDESLFDMEQTESDTAVPAWKITYNDGEIARIAAMDI